MEEDPRRPSPEETEPGSQEREQDEPGGRGLGVHGSLLESTWGRNPNNIV